MNGTSKNVRNWIHVGDHCRGMLAVLERGQPGAVSHLDRLDELGTLSLIRTILHMIGRPDSLIQFVPDCPGHDFRDFLHSKRAMQELECSPRIPIEKGFECTIRWYMEHPEWVAAAWDQQYRA